MSVSFSKTLNFPLLCKQFATKIFQGGHTSRSVVVIVANYIKLPIG